MTKEKKIYTILSICICNNTSMYKTGAPNLEEELFTTRFTGPSSPSAQEVGFLTLSRPNMYDLKSLSD